VFANYLATKYPESFDPQVPLDLVYSGKYKLTDAIEKLGIDAGKLVLSPTRTYAPVIKEILEKLRPQIHGIVHCSGGAQTKVLHFVENIHIIKDNLFPIPPLFKIIREQGKTSWQEMYKVFNMGHRMEIYTNEKTATEIIRISENFAIDAKIVGRCEKADKKSLTLKSEFGEFNY
jgi:phosphoribosylformylglycinamidine cyclo-ligase